MTVPSSSIFAFPSSEQSRKKVPPSPTTASHCPHLEGSGCPSLQREATEVALNPRKQRAPGAGLPLLSGLECSSTPPACPHCRELVWASCRDLPQGHRPGTDTGLRQPVPACKCICCCSTSSWLQQDLWGPGGRPCSLSFLFAEGVNGAVHMGVRLSSAAPERRLLAKMPPAESSLAAASRWVPPPLPDPYPLPPTPARPGPRPASGVRWGAGGGQSREERSRADAAT